MRLAWVFLAACGSVQNSPPMIDAPIQIDAAARIDAAGPLDAPSCGPSDQVDSCGVSCEKCTATGARTTPLCDGVSCQVGCGGNAPKCSDNSCSQLAFDFEDGTPGGATVSSGTLRVASHDGSKALAVPATWTSTSQVAVFVTLPICLTGAVDLSKLALSFDVFYDDPGAPAGEQYYTEVWSPNRVNPNTSFVLTSGITANTRKNLSGAMSSAAASSSAPTILFELGSFGASFAGTVWIDNIKLQ
jgi:hypothetical protein